MTWLWLSLAFRNLFRNRRRTCAILLTIALGTGALFAFAGFIRGVLDGYKDSIIHSHYGYGQINTRGYRETVFEKPSDHWMGNRQELEQFLLGIHGVEKVFPRVSFSALITNGYITVSGLAQGIDAASEAAFFHSLDVEEGEPLVHQKDGILLGRGLANALGVHPGDTVTVIATDTTGQVGQSPFVVSGIFHTGKAEFDGHVFRMQLNEAQSLLKTDKIELFSLGLKDSSHWNGFALQVEQAFPHLEAASFAELDKIHYGHSVEWLKAQFQVVQVIILAIVLLGIFNTISSAILERKQEIGNMRANGESIWQIMQLILLEGALLACLGCALGLSLTYFVLMTFVDQGILMPPSPGSTRQFFVTFSFEWSMVASALLLSILASLIASTMAGLRVACMPIAKALRSE